MCEVKDGSGEGGWGIDRIQARCRTSHSALLVAIYTATQAQLRERLSWVKIRTEGSKAGPWTKLTVLTRKSPRMSQPELHSSPSCFVQVLLTSFHLSPFTVPFRSVRFEFAMCHRPLLCCFAATRCGENHNLDHRHKRSGEPIKMVTSVPVSFPVISRNMKFCLLLACGGGPFSFGFKVPCIFSLRLRKKNSSN